MCKQSNDVKNVGRTVQYSPEGRNQERLLTINYQVLCNKENVLQNGIFRIPYVQKSDEAQYTCRASNSAGSAEIRTVLYVSGGKYMSDYVLCSFDR